MVAHIILVIFPFLSLFSVGNAFPSIPSDVASKISSDLRGLVAHQAEKRLLFDPLTTPIEVTGDHTFIAPDFSAGDQRGPCPALNALANHGYIRRDGVTTLVEATAAINSVFGMGLDLGSLLATMGTVFVGNPLSLAPGFSIGGYDTGVENVLGNLFGLLGTPRGLIGSHNIIEGDSSNTRNDIYQTGDASTLQLDKFIAWYNMSTTAAGDFTMDLIAERANIRFQESKATNPNFYYGPFTGMVARNAGYVFPGRLFANHSQENPTGTLNKEVLKSFFGITGEEGKFTYKVGEERIPENWYRTPVDYGVLSLNLDLIDWILKYPELGSIGGNTGTVKSFTGVDLGDLTGGILNVATLLEGNNLLCFIFEIVKTAAPNSLSTLFSVLEVPLKLVTDAIGLALLDIACPAFKDLIVGGQSFEEGIQSLFPGAKTSGSVF